MPSRGRSASTFFFSRLDDCNALVEIRLVLGLGKKIIDAGNGDAIVAVVALPLAVGLDFGGGSEL